MQKVRDNIICSAVALLSAVVAGGCEKAEPDRQQSETTFAGKLVTFDTPKNWILQKQATKVGFEAFQFLIPDPATDGTPDSANAGIVIEKAQDDLDVTNFASLHLQTGSEPPGNALVTTIFGNDKWCSAVTRGQQGETPYIIMDRFGVDHGVTVFFRVAQPILQNHSSVAESISNFNSVVRSLKIYGTNAVNSEMREDRGTIWLREFGDTDTNWMTNNLTVRSSLKEK